ncbi:MAG: TA system VapC family ribonuclease toxin [Actinomycetota bacterium]
MIRLLDLNLLVAVAWPNHAAHHTALRWFDRIADHGWATCGVTESGFVRISANPTVFASAVTPSDAAALLADLRQVGDHAFWPDEISLATSPLVPRERLIGHRQVTDAHLLAITRSHHGALATLDRRLETLGRGLDGAHVEVVTAE